MRTRRIFCFLIGGAALAALTGCSSPPPPPPPGVVRLNIVAADDINPDPSGRPSPAVVRIYQLGASTGFEKADYFQLFDKESATLGPDLVARDEVTMSPGQTNAMTIPLKPATRFIAVAVSYREIDKANWRAVLEVPQIGTTNVDARLKTLDVTLAKTAS